MRSDYAGALSGTFVKKLYYKAAEQSRINRESGRYQENSRTLLFTARQAEVAALMCEGRSYRQIAEELEIAFSTVRSHIELIYRKLDVSNMTEAVLKIRRLHILDEM